MLVECEKRRKELKEKLDELLYALREFHGRCGGGCLGGCCRWMFSRKEEEEVKRREGEVENVLFVFSEWHEGTALI